MDMVVILRQYYLKGQRHDFVLYLSGAGCAKKPLPLKVRVMWLKGLPIVTRSSRTDSQPLKILTTKQALMKSKDIKDCLRF